MVPFPPLPPLPKELLDEEVQQLAEALVTRISVEERRAQAKKLAEEWGCEVEEWMLWEGWAWWIGCENCHEGGPTAPCWGCVGCHGYWNGCGCEACAQRDEREHALALGRQGGAA